MLSLDRRRVHRRRSRTCRRSPPRWSGSCAFNRGHAEDRPRVTTAVRRSTGRGPARPAREPAQFSLLVVVNAFVGAMVGMERSILPAIAEQEFHLAARTAVLSFIVVFGVTKALTNYLAGRLRRSRRPQARAGRRLARRGAGAVPADVGAELELDPRRERRCSASARASPGRRRSS